MSVMCVVINVNVALLLLETSTHCAFNLFAFICPIFVCMVSAHLKNYPNMYQNVKKQQRAITPPKTKLSLCFLR